MPTADLTVPTTIHAQLGGRRFNVMTGAREFVGSVDTLRFRVGSNAKRITIVTVRLDPNDTYTVTFYRGGSMNLKKAAEVSGVYADNLAAVFTQHTGMYTTL